MNFGFVPFLLLFIPILEIAVFILVGGQIGVIATLAMILVTAILGSILLRIQGFATLNTIQMKANSGEIPGKELVSGVMIMIAGVLLLTPGFVTDSIGFLLFFPPFRQFLWSSIASKVVIKTESAFRNAQTQGHSSYHQYEEGVVDLDPSEYSETKNPNTPWKPVDKE
ncbi:MAG: FxsA family protein [Rhizobiaceae bacterium]|nr:FxsA family protein [Rhizobiaceae bacterium]